MAEMHAVALAVAPYFAVFARFLLAHPVAISVGFKALLPHLPELILVDISLIVLTSNGGAGGDASVDEDTGHLRAGNTLVEVVADLSFPLAQKTLAGV